MTSEQQTGNTVRENIPQGIHVVAKPAGPRCNLSCDYCFYLEKEVLFDTKQRFEMSDDVLSLFIDKYVTSQPTPEVEFVWQGGEPTLRGLDFYKRVVELQKPYTRLKTISNVLQTNGTLLTDDWCVFFKENDFLVGVSLDGPQEIHDRYRRNRSGQGSFLQTMKGLQLLQKHEVNYNVLASVGRETARQPLEVYQFLREIGVEYIQFAPVVERLPNEKYKKNGFRLSGPAELCNQEQQTDVTPWTVLPEEYGDFLIAIYEEWVHHDVGNIFVMNFEWALNAWLGEPSSVCVHAQQCGGSLVLEHNGDIYACDHFVYPEYRLGNIKNDLLTDLTGRSRNTGFGRVKETALPGRCRECEVLAACRGGCPKHRFTMAINDEPGLHYLCPGYNVFFRHIRKYLHAMAQLIDNGMPASYVMKAIKGPLIIQRASQ